MNNVVKMPSRLRSIHVLADSFASIKLVQEEILTSGKTYKELAAKAQLANSTVSNIASGQTKMPRIETIIRILGALDWVIQAVRKA